MHSVIPASRHQVRQCVCDMFIFTSSTLTHSHTHTFAACTCFPTWRRCCEQWDGMMGERRSPGRCLIWLQTASHGRPDWWREGMREGTDGRAAVVNSCGWLCCVTPRRGVQQEWGMGWHSPAFSCSRGRRERRARWQTGNICEPEFIACYQNRI